MKLLEDIDVQWKPLADVAKITIGEFVHQNNQNKEAEFPVYNGGITPTGYYDKFNNTGDKIIVSARGANAGFVNRISKPYWAGNSCYSIGINDPTRVNWVFIYYFIKANENKLIGSQQKGGIPAVSKKQMEVFLVPIPSPEDSKKSIEIQKEIVRILDSFTEYTAELTAELTARKKQYIYYREQLLGFDDGDVEWKTLESLAENLDSMRKPVTGGLREAGNIPYYGASGIVDYVKSYIFDGDFLLVSEDGANLIARNTPIAFSISGKTWVNNHAHVLKFNTYAERKFVEYFLNSIDLTPYISGAAQPKLNQKNLNSIKIPDPSPKEKERIVTILDKFDILTNSISEGLPKEIELRKKQYEYYRDLLLTFPKNDIES